MDSITELFVD